MELVANSQNVTITGNFCVNQISHSQPQTEVVVKMGKDVYQGGKANIEKYYHADKELLSFFSGVFCDKIEVSAPDAHVIVVYEDVANDDRKDTKEVA